MGVQGRLIKSNQTRLQSMPGGLQRNHPRMDVGGPQPSSLIPSLVILEPILEALTLAHVIRPPEILWSKSSKYVYA